MKIAVDTNVLARAVLQDHPKQSRAASDVLSRASLIAVPLPCLCELVWILRRSAQLPKEKIVLAIRTLMDAENVAMDRPAVEAGLAMLEVGGDFADGAIAHEGSWLGGEVFVSFDKKAATLLSRQGKRVKLL